jgi:hypothetical protein
MVRSGLRATDVVLISPDAEIKHGDAIASTEIQ